MSSSKNIPEFLSDPDFVLKEKDINWRSEKVPDYSKANQLYNAEKKNTFKAGSFPEMISNLIKNWEKEASHKPFLKEWRTISPDFKVSVNGSPWVGGDALIEVGSYNALLGDSEYYAGSKLSFEDSHEIFRKVLSSGFAWEIFDFYSGNGKPEKEKIVFKWRHWGKMEGEFKCPIINVNNANDFSTIPPSYENIEIFGICILKLNPATFQMEELEVFYNPLDIFKKMTDSQKSK